MKLIINGYGTFLGAKNGMICVKKDGKESEIAVGNVDVVILATKGIAVSSAFFRLAADNNIDVIVLDSNGKPIGRFTPLTKKGNVRVRKEQYAAQNDARGFHLAKSFARGKVMNQYYLLKSLAKNRKRKDILDLCYKIKEGAAKIDKLDGRNRAGIIREEAKAAEIYWKGISEFFGDLGFEARRKRYDEPKDPVNVMLNYGYSVLMSRVWIAVEMTCLDPFAGFLHEENPRRPALVVDLMEEFRQPVVDRAVFRCASRDLVENGKLTAKGRRILLQEIEKRLGTRVTFANRKLPIEYHMILQARRIERFLLGKGNYAPFVLR